MSTPLAAALVALSSLAVSFPHDDIHTVTPDFRYLEHDRVYTFTPTNRAARVWADENETFQAFARMGSAYAVPKEQYADVIDLIDAAGFHFTKGA